MKSIILFGLLFFQLTAYSQDCRLVKRTTKKSADIQRRGGSAESNDYLLLSLERSYDPKNPEDTLNYHARTIIGANYTLKDSVISAGGKFEFDLSNGETLIWDNAKASNLGAVLMTPYPNHIMFSVTVTKKQFELLTKYSITKLRTFDIVETEFGAKSQRQLLTIADCLTKEQN